MEKQLLPAAALNADQSLRPSAAVAEGHPKHMVDTKIMADAFIPCRGKKWELQGGAGPQSFFRPSLQLAQHIHTYVYLGPRPYIAP